MPDGKPVPGLISDLVVSMDEQIPLFRQLAARGCPAVRHESDPFKPKLTGEIYIGGLLGKAGAIHGRKLVGGPQMSLELSLDGRRLFVTNSLYSTWNTSSILRLPSKAHGSCKSIATHHAGGLSVDERMFVDFGQEPSGPVRAHEVRYPGSDPTSRYFHVGSCHRRHAFICDASAGGRTLAKVRNAAGHANVSITNGYLRVAVPDVSTRGGRRNFA